MLNIAATNHLFRMVIYRDSANKSVIKFGCKQGSY